MSLYTSHFAGRRSWQRPENQAVHAEDREYRDGVSTCEDQAEQRDWNAFMYCDRDHGSFDHSRQAGDQCTTTANIAMAATDRFYLWVGRTPQRVEMRVLRSALSYDRICPRLPRETLDQKPGSSSS